MANMAHKNKNILFQEIDPPQELFSAILARIARARQRAARIRIAVFSSGLFISVVMLVPAVSYLAHEFYASGFYDYVSVFFVDNTMATTYWRELLISMAETLPSLAILLLLGLVAVALWSLRYVMRDFKTALIPIQLA
jgi:hypothetical protein